LALGAVVLAAGCQQAPPPAPRTEVRATFAALRAEGDSALKVRDWTAAARAYEQALIYEPPHLAVRYGRAIALSHLDRRDEAITAFLWVVDNAPLTAEESRVARQWLVEAGVRPPPEAAASAAASGDTAQEAAAGGRLRGKTQWTSLEPGVGPPQLQILLEGDDSATQGRRYWAKVKLNDPYEIAKVVPGRYRMSAQVGPIRLWDTSVTVADGNPTVLDLTPATSIAPANALRPAQS
jgi:hypothetical protein